MDNFTDSLNRMFTASAERLMEHLPQFLGALALLLVGWALARLLRIATRRAVTLLDSLVSRSTGQSRWDVRRSAAVFGGVVYWVVLLFFVTAATQMLGLQYFTDWLARLLEHLPALAAGLLIVVAGFVLSGFFGDLVQATATRLAPPQRRALSRLAQGATLAVALLVGADQVGLKVTWVAILAAVIVATVLGGVALAVSLGARGYVANLIGAFYMRQALQLGQRVLVAGHEGYIVDVTATSLVLETNNGRILLPGRVYHDEAIVIFARTDAN
ncbi:Mechanosensitive ion channel [Candidatus Nitrotoga sp. BS]|uniref:mechanosensitive ion channel family protein n=1 Tax=Candidatus Nitrotoga sp. BS TaxID=2890408 RepID=UPI001EF23265|nr:mechanosensitive ion channel domain-containing protein [Candidatus Nitrotoga sp. BS]CAH1198191.1 Mechanosensitive ion channel [Candidatus Nitrotoga sp. BS]